MLQQDTLTLVSFDDYSATKATHMSIYVHINVTENWETNETARRLGPIKGTIPELDSDRELRRSVIIMNNSFNKTSCSTVSKAEAAVGKSLIPQQ
jgi:hypothetical protein